MNIRTKLFAIILVITGIVFLSSCIKDEFDAPPVIIPSVDFSSNCSISGLKTLYTGTLMQITSDTIIQGIVVANDESGNFYKTLVIQDNSAGIEIKLDKTDLYTQYRLGQRIYIKCKDLYLGDYGGLVQLGYIYNGAIGRIPEVYIKDHLFLDSLPGVPPAPVVVSIPSLSAGNLDMLVKFENVFFETPGEVFATSDVSATNRNIKDDLDNTLILRTSSYADFAANKLPDGSGTITGILSIYNGDYQFYIRDINDLSGFSASSSSTIVAGNFSTAGSLDPFTQYSVLGNEVWTQSTYSGENFAKMSGYSGGSYHANEDWLISPSMNLDQYTSEKMKFFSMMNYGTAGDGSLKLYYSTDYSSGDPSTATWTEITGFTLSSGSWTKVQSGDIDLSAITGSNVHVAFKYTCSTTNVATWEIGGVLIKGNM